MTSCPAFSQIAPSVLPMRPDPMTPIFKPASIPLAARTAYGNTPKATPAAAVPAARRNSRRLGVNPSLVFIASLPNMVGLDQPAQ